MILKSKDLGSKWAFLWFWRWWRYCNGGLGFQKDGSHHWGWNLGSQWDYLYQFSIWYVFRSGAFRGIQPFPMSVRDVFEDHILSEEWSALKTQNSKGCIHFINAGLESLTNIVKGQIPLHWCLASMIPLCKLPLGPSKCSYM